MPRIQYFDVDSATGKHAEFLEKLKPHLNIYRMLANSEAGLKGFIRMGNALLFRCELDPVLRELAIIRVGRLSRAAYEVFQHERIAREAGVDEAKIAALREATIEAPAFTDNEKAVLRFTDDVVRNVKASDKTLKAVQAFLTGREFVEMAARLHELPDPRAAADQAIRTVDLQSAADRAVGGYSKGMRQRAKIAAALVHEPSILLLDEPFNGMDPRQRLHMMDLLRTMAVAGRTILFSSHILEEVERIADGVLVIVAGRLAAAGDFREIRRLMTDRPHTFVVRSSDDRRLAAAFMSQPAVFATELRDGRLTVRVQEFAGFTGTVAGVARDANVSLFEVAPTDDSLESVFAYLVSGVNR